MRNWQERVSGYTLFPAGENSVGHMTVNTRVGKTLKEAHYFLPDSKRMLGHIHSLITGRALMWGIHSFCNQLNVLLSCLCCSVCEKLPEDIEDNQKEFF